MTLSRMTLGTETTQKKNKNTTPSITALSITIKIKNTTPSIMVLSITIKIRHSDKVHLMLSVVMLSYIFA